MSGFSFQVIKKLLLAKLVIGIPFFSDIGDKLIEVVGLENCLHMGQVRTGLRSSGKRLAQCSHVIVKIKKRFPMQVDGEPWEQPPGTVRRSMRFTQGRIGLYKACLEKVLYQ